jgi:carboxypeptidase C (cathepsin A)
VEKFFEIHPSFASNDLFITGESYAGVYVPTLAEAIVFAVGNNTYKGAPLKGRGGTKHPTTSLCSVRSGCRYCRWQWLCWQ